MNDEVRLEFSDADSVTWKQRLLSARSRLAPAIRAVGRIEVRNHPLTWLGTGWLIDDEVVVTNRHVAEEFGYRAEKGFVFRQGVGGPMSAAIDFLEEIGRSDSREFQIKEILHIEPGSGDDVAFLRVEQISGSELAAPIALSERAPETDQFVAVIGYPARDARLPEQELMDRIFGDVYEKKRLAPGQVSGTDRGSLLHDCSTLGGNSGSAVLDLESGAALGLHFAGRFLEANFAVPATRLTQLLSSVRLPRRRVLVPVTRARVVTAVAEPTNIRQPEATVTMGLAVPLQVRVSIGNVRPIQSRQIAGARTIAAWRGANDGEEEDREPVLAEGRPEDYVGRDGYRPDFIEGFEILLPRVVDDADVLTFIDNGREESVLAYRHFSVVMSRRHRLCHFSAVNVDGARSCRRKRPEWRLDPRIPAERQIRYECYGNPPRFSRGHMTRREDPIWGEAEESDEANRDSMHVTNAAPQVLPFNAGIWLGLEDYALDHARQDDMCISVFTGPVFRADDPVRYDVQIPRTFWKVIAFIHDESGQLSATGYTLSQDQFLREEEFVFGQHETQQVPLAHIEQVAGVSFGELREHDPLGRMEEARARPLSAFNEIRFVAR